MSYVIATSRNWHPEMADNVKRRINQEIVLIGDRRLLTPEYLGSIKAELIFFPHWSYIIPATIYEAFECIIFHMTDLPFGRGGSPLQNLLARGIYETQISALRCVKEVDAGPIYLKKPLALQGNAQEIYVRANHIIEDMIVTIIQERPEPREQEGTVVSFKRRTERDGDLSGLESLEQVYDFIRMLDAEGYPRAFLETANFRLEFSRASLRSGEILADVVIKKRDHEK
jgi:methionyl-tRNA formyltransferase